jgi:hypothetical protein
VLALSFFLQQKPSVSRAPRPNTVSRYGAQAALIANCGALNSLICNRLSRKGELCQRSAPCNSITGGMCEFQRDFDGGREQQALMLSAPVSHAQDTKTILPTSI